MKLPAISLGQEMLSRFDDAIQREWLLTNGLGGYASSTVLGINTRKYHGLLVAAFYPPGDRRVSLEKLDEEVSIGSDSYPLGANEFQDGIFPQGYMFLKEFSMAPFPKYVYMVQNVEVQKTIFVPNEKNAVIAFYKILNKNGFDVKIQIFPLINCRHFHSVMDGWKNQTEFVQRREGNTVNICSSIPKSVLMMRTTSGQYYDGGKWIKGIYYREEAVRGESCVDDCYQPGYFEVEVKAEKREELAITAVADENSENARRILGEMPRTMYDAENLFEREVERRENLLTKFHELHEKIPANEWLNWIILATDTFIVNTNQKSAIAGYHWFEVWGRDTFVSLPGLMLVTGRFEDARKTFLVFKKHCKDGLIPNFISDQARQPAYNAVDATLWYVNAVLQYLKYTGDFKFVQERLWETLEAIVEGCMEGTAFNIRVESDGLLSHGPQLTWMDTAATLRDGKAVEVQALWYNALKIMELLAIRFKEKDEAEKYAQTAEKARKSFVEKFWNPEKNCLFDVVSDHGRDASLRPNQIFAVALDFTMLDDAKNEKAVDAVHRELLTPYGLRTLTRNDLRYVGVYAGDRRSRDKAYHNGTVWPWLLGPFTTAYLKAKGYAEQRREYALKNFLLPLFTEQIFKSGLGTISEIFDGDSPHVSRGCIAQAWSIAEPFRAYIEDVMQARPKYERTVLQGSR